MSLSDFYATHGDYKTRQVLTTRDSKKDVVGAAAAATTTDVIDSLREAVPIYINDDYGEGVIPYLTDALQAVDARVPYRSVISPSATDDQIVEELYKLMTMQTRVFIVHMFPSLGARLFAKAKEIGMMSEGYVWIMTDGLTADFLSSPNRSVTDTIQGVLGVKPFVPRTNDLKIFRDRWKRKFQQDNPDIVDTDLNIFGLWAYDAATALALAVEKAGTTNSGFQKENVSSNSSTDLATLGVSLNGPNLLQALSNTAFKGLTGDYLFVNGQLQASAFQIINVNGNGGREIGFWTPTEGIVKTLNTTKNMTASSTSNSGLSAVIWPGDTTSVPKGWEIPTSGRKLRIVVPVKDGFSEFVKVTTDPISNTSKATGYCIDVFDAVVKALPYALPYEYIPFAKPDGEPAGTYNDLIYQVYLKSFEGLPHIKQALASGFPSQPRFLHRSYTASLTSLLTVQQLQPAVNDVNFLIKKGEFVGYQEGSFVQGILLGLGFDKSKLIVYNSIEECDDLLSKGSGNGGIAAAFDEVPFMKLLLSKYCSKYTMIDHTFKTDGFGFVSSSTLSISFPLSCKFLNPDTCLLLCVVTFQAFHKGSPLVPDVSRAVLNMTEGDKMNEIEDACFGKQSNCPDSSTSVTSNSLSLKSFWGLFLIAGIASLLALIMFMVMFVYQERKVLSSSASKDSVMSKVRNFFRIFIQRDLNSHTFRKSELNCRSAISQPSMASPSAYSVSTYFPGDGDQCSAEYGDSSLDRQASHLVVMNIDQLTNPNQERLAGLEMDHEND
ncbi:unnamed protein product [Dovyalis caffra]|uniref:Glutamate receptor n=1 Tax=Dovyalis caffra TaxID=77055 RepID=A0AAV1SLE3_9ROSI|nr:unnamed protein product [Dovyalis caffra]